MKEHILAGLSSAPSSARIIRTAAAMASAFGCGFTVLFVHTPNYEVMSDADKEWLRSNTKLAEALGATVETVFGDGNSCQIAEYARLSGITAAENQNKPRYTLSKDRNTPAAAMQIGISAAL